MSPPDVMSGDTGCTPAHPDTAGGGCGLAPGPLPPGDGGPGAEPGLLVTLGTVDFRNARLSESRIPRAEIATPTQVNSRSSRRARHRPSKISRPAAGSLDAQLLHSKSERVRMDAQALGGVAGAVDPPTTSFENGLDVRALHGVEIIR